MTRLLLLPTTGTRLAFDTNASTNTPGFSVICNIPHGCAPRTPNEVCVRDSSLMQTRVSQTDYVSNGSCLSTGVYLRCELKKERLDNVGTSVRRIVIGPNPQ
ncbi:hypothetical protein LZ32DRAFT_605439 [Colletotrichum eremochloae]|nr:hypothetical protein LZ32DRAFT_605439 [Colletotrichum eremochloae]